MGDAEPQGLSAVRGHESAKALLRRAAAQGRLASAYLFAGPRGVGKDRVARALAQMMNCAERPHPGADPCGQCAPCQRMLHQRHADLMVLQRELKDPPKDPDAAPNRAWRTGRLEDIPEDDLRQILRIEQVRELLSAMPYRPHEGGTRWVIVREADRFHPGAANAFLKTLEEPPEATHFVLLTHRPSALLSTIRSRCQVVRFGVLSSDDVRSVLSTLDVDRDRVDALAALSDGSVGRALEFRDQEVHARREELVTRLLGALRTPGKESPVGSVAEVSEALKAADKRDLDGALTLLQRHFRNECVAAAASNPRVSAVSAARAEVVRETLEGLDGGANLNAQYALQAMLVKLREARP
ncbi:MAG: DNA polymerase III subunit delta' [Polyangiales bacterium]